MAQIMTSKYGEKGEKMEFIFSENMPNILISYEVDDFDGFPSISEESKEKYRKLENFMQKSNFRKQISNEDSMEESEQISQEKFLIRSFPDPKENLLCGTRIPKPSKPSGSQDNEDTMEEMSQDVSEPSESEDEMGEIKYEIFENSSKQGGNTIITDSRGFSYSGWRYTSNGSTQEFRCIKRHNPEKGDCKSILTVKNRGEENQEIIRNDKDHNHEPNKNLNINRQLKIDIKKDLLKNLQNLHKK